MLAIVTLTYKVPLDAVQQHTGEHRAYLRTLHEQGKLLASGPFVPRIGGALLVRADDEDGFAAIVAGDPFHVLGIADHEVRVWAPNIGAEGLAEL